MSSRAPTPTGYDLLHYASMSKDGPHEPRAKYESLPRGLWTQIPQNQRPAFLSSPEAPSGHGGTAPRTWFARFGGHVLSDPPRIHRGNASRTTYEVQKFTSGPCDSNPAKPTTGLPPEAIGTRRNRTPYVVCSIWWSRLERPTPHFIEGIPHEPRTKCKNLSRDLATQISRNQRPALLPRAPGHGNAAFGPILRPKKSIITPIFFGYLLKNPLVRL